MRVYLAALLCLAAATVLTADSLTGLTGESDVAERGRVELRRVRSLATEPGYGECWSRALEHLDTRCRDMTSQSQSRIALKFTHCHLHSSGRDFPSCPEGSEVSRCTANMDVVAFNAYTEFFTHTHSICHFLQSEAWQHRAENTMHWLTESSAGVAEQLQSTRQMAEDLIEAQSATLLTQEEILHNGEELRHTLRDSTQGLRDLFSELSVVSRDQQVALSELFNRVSFLQNFLLLEAHSLSSWLYNAGALCASFLLTSTQRTSRARLILFGLVCVNVYLERMIYQSVLNSDIPEHKHMELVSVYVCVLRRVMLCVCVCVLVCVCVRYRDPVQQSLEVLLQLRETQRSLQLALQHAEELGERRRSDGTSQTLDRCRRREEKPRREEESGEEDGSTLIWPSVIATDSSVLSHHSHSGWNNDSVLSSTVNSSAAQRTLLHTDTHNTLLSSHTTRNAVVQSPSTQNAIVSPGTLPRCSSSSRHPSSSSSSPLVYSILVDDKQPRYSLRSRRSLKITEAD